MALIKVHSGMNWSQEEHDCEESALYSMHGHLLAGYRCDKPAKRNDSWWISFQHYQYYGDIDLHGQYGYPGY